MKKEIITNLVSHTGQLIAVTNKGRIIKRQGIDDIEEFLENVNRL